MVGVTLEHPVKLIIIIKIEITLNITIVVLSVFFIFSLKSKMNTLDVLKFIKSENKLEAKININDHEFVILLSLFPNSFLH